MIFNIKPSDAEKLRDIDSEPRLRIYSNPSQPMIRIALVVARRGGKYFANHIAYDDVWPQTLLAEWGVSGAMIWREVRRQMKGFLIFDLFKSENEKRLGDLIDVGKYMTSDQEIAFTEAAIQIIAEREELKRSA